MTDRRHAALCEKCVRKCKQPANCKVILCLEYAATDKDANDGPAIRAPKQ